MHVKQQAAPVPNLSDSDIPIFGALFMDSFCGDHAASTLLSRALIADTNSIDLCTIDCLGMRCPLILPEIMRRKYHQTSKQESKNSTP